MTGKTMYVRLDQYQNRCGLLHCDAPAHPGYGLVQLGSGGPNAFVPLDELTPISAEEFQAYLEDLPPPKSATKVRK